MVMTLTTYVLLYIRPPGLAGETDEAVAFSCRFRRFQEVGNWMSHDNRVQVSP